MTKYDEFLENKKIKIGYFGIDPVKPINDKLYPFQSDIVRWSLKKGKAAIFADCGLGKTAMQLEWAEHISIYSSKPVLIIAPLAVSRQTVKEGKKFNINSSICRTSDDIDPSKPSINITNYEMLHKIDQSKFIGVVLDESSILKHFSNKYRKELIEKFYKTRYKLACTATPAPNDYMELGNHSEFLNIMKYREMLATFFVHDGGDTSKWRLKGHAEKLFWQWMSKWSVYIQSPSDIGYDDNGFLLPPINIHEIMVDTDFSETTLFDVVRKRDLNGRREARRDSIGDRVKQCEQIINSSGKQNEPWLIWCNLNNESVAVVKSIDGFVEITGSDQPEVKEAKMNEFSEGGIIRLVTKPKIAGFGMNWQHCSNVIFLGLSDSWEQYYQAIRRTWRYGQENEVNVYVVISELEGDVLRNIRRKERDAMSMAKNIIANTSLFTKVEIKGENMTDMKKDRIVIHGEKYVIYNDDCISVTNEIPDEIIHYSLFSPPFADLYTYSDDHKDMGNSRSYDQFFEHFEYLVKNLYRITYPGRLVTFHCMDIPIMKEKDGYIGLRDFPGDLIRMFEKHGFIYHGKHTVWKDPLIEATRTKALGLLHKSIMSDSSKCRAGLPDYVITMRKRGDNPIPIMHPDGFTRFIGVETDIPNDGVFSHQVWRKYASPIWTDINQTRTLQRDSARDEKDEKHICPLQLDVIERCIELYTNEGETVLDPFAGIGSTGYVAGNNERRFIGIELKKSYFSQMEKNVAILNNQLSLFDTVTD